MLNRKNAPAILITKSVILMGDYQINNGSYQFEVYPKGQKRYLAVDFAIDKNIENEIDYICVTSDANSINLADYQQKNGLMREFIVPIADTCPLNQLKIAAFKKNPIKITVYVSDFIINHINPHLLTMMNNIIPPKNSNHLKFFQPIRKPLEIIIEDKKATDIPDNLCCAISYELMENPVLCSLDNRYYEEKMITEWLTKHRNSPYSLQFMEANQLPKDVLTRDAKLKELTQEFRQKNPHLFDESRPAKKKKI